jgi:OmpA-OmpF porin, OOP family
MHTKFNLIVPTDRARTTLLTLGIAGLSVLSGCASGPNFALEQSRLNYDRAAQEADIKAFATADLADAQKTLEAAERTWQEEEDYDETSHLTYVTDRQLELARAQAQHTRAQKELAALSNERDQSRLQMRDLEIEKLQARLQAKRTAEGILITLGDVLFDTGRADLKAGSLQSLYPLVEHLRVHPNSRVKILGYTDSRGTTSYNEELSLRRTEAVADFLTANGVESNRIITRGLGKNYPVTTNLTAAGRQQNRRVEITVSDGGAEQQVTWPSKP